MKCTVEAKESESVLALPPGTSFPVGTVEFSDLHPPPFTEFMQTLGGGGGGLRPWEPKTHEYVGSRSPGASAPGRFS